MKTDQAEIHFKRNQNTVLFFDVLVLSPPRRTVLVLVIEAIRYSNLAHWSASYRKPPRSTVGIAAVQTAIEYEYDEIRCEVDQVV
jgi:hypothetical protein